MTQKPDVTDVNAKFLDEAANRVHPVMVAAFGLMNAPTRDEVRKELEFSVEVLRKHPEAERTHGRISLFRSPLGFGYDIGLHLGPLNHFENEEV